MRDRDTEIIVHPRDLLSLEGVERVLCVAPHPDDEVLGCGGLLAALVDRGCAVHTLILTGGEQGRSAASGKDGKGVALPDDAAQAATAPHLVAQRRQESERAAKELGTPPPHFLGFADRTLRCGPALIQALAAAIAQHDPQILLLPSLSEPHPDHQAAALAGLSAARDAGSALHTILYYECGAPLHANLHFPFDDVAERKWSALRCFASQLDVEDYEPHARAMAALRAFGLRPSCRQAESFFKVDLQAVRARGALAALPQWPWVRQGLGLANDPDQVPLVSVLVRSMDRPCLAEALASVALQTHARVELVVVNASGHAHRPLDFLPPGLTWRLVEPAPGHTGPLARAQAANRALEAAQGDWALFLDDDDLIEPHHLERLVRVLADNPAAAGAYAGVRVESPDGSTARIYDLPWSRQRLEGVNFLPIHAVLFRMGRVRDHALRFDEALPVLEDWDFWLQLTDGAELLHCPGVSAVYRQGLGASSLADPQHPHHWRVWHARMLQDRLARWGAPSAAATLAWHAVELDRLQAESERASLEAERSRVREAALAAGLAQASMRADEALALAGQHQATVQGLQQQLEAFGRESQAALAAREEALQRVAADGARLLAERELQAQRFAADSQAALNAKETALLQQARDFEGLLHRKELELQRFAAESQAALGAKESALRAYSQQVQQTLDAKEAELQRQAAEAAGMLQAREAEHAARSGLLQQQLAAAQARVSQRELELRTLQSSRSWRWTAPLRRQRGPADGS
jgi:LmbE family N-acetylglucosaminyl deacetylase